MTRYADRVKELKNPNKNKNGDSLSENLMLPRTSKATNAVASKGLFPEQRTTAPVFDQENFGFKPSKQQPPDIMKPNKRISYPAEPVSSRNFAKPSIGPGNIWKMSARPETEQSGPYFESDDHVLKEINQMDIEYRSEPDRIEEEPLKVRPQTAGVPGYGSSYTSNLMDVERPQLGNIMQAQPEFYGNRDMGRDPLLMAREKRQAQKRSQVDPSEESLEEMRRRHKELIDGILKDEDALLVKQKEVLDSKILKIKDEMTLLNSFEKGGRQT